MERDLTFDKTGEWHGFWRDYQRRLEGISSYALTGIREGARFLDALRCDRYTVVRGLREDYKYDPNIGQFLPRQAPTFTDTRQVSHFFAAILNWTVLNQAVVSAENVLEATALAMTPEAKFCMAVRRALARLCTPHAHLIPLMNSPFEFVRAEVVAALSAWTVTKTSLEINVTLSEMLVTEGSEPFKELLSRLPARVFEALGNPEHGSSHPRDVAENALTNMSEGQPLTAGGDPVANKVVGSLERELRDGQWVKPWNKKRVKYVPLPESIAEDLELHEASR